VTPEGHEIIVCVRGLGEFFYLMATLAGFSTT